MMDLIAQTAEQISQGWPPWLIAVGLFLGTGGIAAVVTAIIKIRPEVHQITVDAAKGAVVVQAQVLDDVREELSAIRDRLSKTEARLIEAMSEAMTARRRVEELERHLSIVEGDRDRLRRERDELRDRVSTLEREVHELKENST